MSKILRMLASSSTTRIVPLSPDKFLNAVPNERELLTLHYLLIRSQKRKTIWSYSQEERSDRLILASVQQIMLGIYPKKIFMSN
ncbi:MAG: hypothetical protein V7L11_22340 [Nostoc sp.]|uniref:hypothetical protein n=1 Tax=Nostoc sp. TaxID=1180 RepID=UPI002FFCA9EB